MKVGAITDHFVEGTYVPWEEWLWSLAAAALFEARPPWW